MVWINPISDFGLGFLVPFIASKYVLTVGYPRVLPSSTTWAGLNIVCGSLLFIRFKVSGLFRYWRLMAWRWVYENLGPWFLVNVYRLPCSFKPRLQGLYGFPRLAYAR